MRSVVLPLLLFTAHPALAEEAGADAQPPASPAPHSDAAAPEQPPADAPPAAPTSAPESPTAPAGSEAAPSPSVATDDVTADAGARASSDPSATTVGTGVTGTAPATPTTTRIERSGSYFGLGLGAGAAGLSPETIAGPSAGQLSLRSGVIIDDFILAGISVVFTSQYNGWRPQQHVGASMSSLLAEGMIFPLQDLPLNVAVGVGWASALSIKRLADEVTAKGNAHPKVVAASGNGVGWMAAVGWDFLAGRGANLGVQARYDGAALGSLGTSHGGSLHLWVNFY